jgi:hypothetical protein
MAILASRLVRSGFNTRVGEAPAEPHRFETHFDANRAEPVARRVSKGRGLATRPLLTRRATHPQGSSLPFADLRGEVFGGEEGIDPLAFLLVLQSVFAFAIETRHEFFDVGKTPLERVTDADGFVETSDVHVGIVRVQVVRFTGLVDRIPRDLDLVFDLPAEPIPHRGEAISIGFQFRHRSVAPGVGKLFV